MHEIRLRPEAEKDIEDAAFWYENQREGLGSQFLDEILHTLKSVTQQPSLFPAVHRGTRRALIH
jgi:toxin ParE1/3/4